MKRFQAQLGLTGDTPPSCQNSEILKPIKAYNLFLFINIWLTFPILSTMTFPWKTSETGALE